MQHANVPLDLANAGTYTFLCINCSEGMLHAFTWGIAVACMSGAFGGTTLAQTAEWDGFEWLKRLSLLLGWSVVALAWQMNLRADKDPRASVLARRLLQLVLMINVAEAAVLMLEHGNYVGGGLCVLLATISPDWSVVDGDGRLIAEEQVSCLGFPVPVSCRWYMRSYYVILSFPLCFHPRFADYWVFLYISCLWPLFYQEVVAPSENPGVIFKIRAFMLISGLALMDTFIAESNVEASTGIPHPPVEGLLQVNARSTGIIAAFFVAFLMADKLRAQSEGYSKPPLVGPSV